MVDNVQDNERSWEDNSYCRSESKLDWCSINNASYRYDQESGKQCLAHEGLSVPAHYCSQAKAGRWLQVTVPSSAEETSLAAGWILVYVNDSAFISTYTDFCSSQINICARYIFSHTVHAYHITQCWFRPPLPPPLAPQWWEWEGNKIGVRAFISYIFLKITVKIICSY